MKSLYYSFNPEEVAEVPISTPIPAPSTPSRPLLPKELFIEKIGFFADESVLTRNLVMLLSFLAIFWVFYSRYDFITFCFMFVIGVFAFVLVAKKDKTQKITSYMLFFFIILLIIRFSFELIGDISTITFFLGTFPDFSRPDLILLSFSSGILTCIGLDRGNAVDKRSFIIGICSVVFLIIFFLTPLFEMLLAYFRGL